MQSSHHPFAPGIAIALLMAMGKVLGADDFQGATHLLPFDEDTIKYSKTEATGAIARLQQRIDAGQTRLKFDDRHGYLDAVLDALGVPRSSQMLVFSKTSFQRDRISPQTPRALYFNDDVYVGFIPGSPLLEVSTADPKLGGVFYTLEQSAVEKPRFVRSDQCLECHASAKTMGVPGHLIRSFGTDESGVVDLSTGTSLVTHRTPYAERRGGWYVTGTHGDQAHRGNLIGKTAFERQATEPNRHGNVTRLKSYFDPAPYLEPTSDIAAIMVLEHQSHMHNFITRLNYESTLALSAYGHLNYLKSITDSFLRYLLFVDESPLTSPVKGVPGFVKSFESIGPRDGQGRSLRRFNLQTRLFEYPCSYLIYSEAFDQLPEKMKAHLYRRLHDILTGVDATPDFQKIPAASRRAVLEILVATKKNLPDYWRASVRDSR